MEYDFEKVAVKVALITIMWNMILAIVKFVAGVVAHSSAMLSDAVHTSSDVLSSIVVIVGVKISSRDSDQEHPYGHERMECVAAILLSMMLGVTGLGIGYAAISSLLCVNESEIMTPGVFAIVAAVLSILVKELMYWYTRFHAKKIDSSALMADAWHHRSDALSSIGALIGILFARNGLLWMDAVASLIICIFIEKAACSIFKDAIDKMIDKSCGEETEEKIRECALSQEGVLGIDSLHTRIFGRKIYVDLEISADGDRPLKETHAIAQQVHDIVEDNIPKVKHIMIHVNPME